MKRSTRWLAVAGLGLAFLGRVDDSPAQTGNASALHGTAQVAAQGAAQVAAITPVTGATSGVASAPKLAAVRPTAVTPVPSAPPPQASAPATKPAAPTTPAATTPAATTAPVGGTLQTAALTTATGARPDDTTLGERLFAQALDGSRVDPFNWSVHIYKSRHRIELYYKNQLFRTYHAVFGRGGLTGAKQWEGDSRTPEGAYLIIAKHRSMRFRWFLKLNYPNATDEARFAVLRAHHQIPWYRHEGGMVGIHGTDSPLLNLQDVNWTLGCISVANSDIAEIAALLPVGTLVVINP